MKLSLTTKISLFIYKYITGPLIDCLVFLCDFIFILIDKITGYEPPEPLSDKEILREYRKDMKLKKSNVPKELHSLIPLAKKWGIGDDALRGDATNTATANEKNELAKALKGKLEIINQWLDSFEEREITDEAAAFMYLAEAAEELDLDIS